MRFVPGDASIDGNFSGDLLIIFNLDVTGSSLKLSHWVILYTPLGNPMVYISPNWSGDGMLIIF